MDENKTKVDSTNGVDESPWVSPEVAAAMSGEQVDLGKDLSENDDSDDDN